MKARITSTTDPFIKLFKQLKFLHKVIDAFVSSTNWFSDFGIDNIISSFFFLGVNLLSFSYLRSSFLLQKTNLQSDGGCKLLEVGVTIDIVCKMILEKIKGLIDGFQKFPDIGWCCKRLHIMIVFSINFILWSFSKWISDKV